MCVGESEHMLMIQALLRGKTGNCHSGLIKRRVDANTISTRRPCRLSMLFVAECGVVCRQSAELHQPSQIRENPEPRIRTLSVRPVPLLSFWLCCHAPRPTPALPGPGLASSHAVADAQHQAYAQLYRTVWPDLSEGIVLFLRLCMVMLYLIVDVSSLLTSARLSYNFISLCSLAYHKSNIV